MLKDDGEGRVDGTSRAARGIGREEEGDGAAASSGVLQGKEHRRRPMGVVVLDLGGPRGKRKPRRLVATARGGGHGDEPRAMIKEVPASVQETFLERAAHEVRLAK